MKTEILMPSLSPTMEEGSLAKWYVSPGDKVKPGDIIADIETDKALMEYESIEEGTIVELIVKEGTENIKVNSLIAVIETEGAEEINISEVDDISLETYLSNHIDNKSFNESNGENYSQICELLREMAVRSYKLSEYVLINKLRYVPVPGYYDGNVDV